MGCLNSKVYIIWGEKDENGEIKFKISCKGTQKKRNHLEREHFKRVLETKQPHIVENAGFIRGKDGVIKTYTEVKTGMGYFYAKKEISK